MTARALIVNESHDAALIVADVIEIGPRQEDTVDINDAVTVVSDGAVAVSVINQGAEQLLITQGEAGLYVMPGQTFCSFDEAEPVHIAVAS